MLLKANATELSVAPDGNSVAYNSADGHFSMNRYVLKLIQPKSAKELPQASGAPQQMTFGRGKWHVHGGAWSQDNRWIVYTRDFDRGNLNVIDNYRRVAEADPSRSASTNRSRQSNLHRLSCYSTPKCRFAKARPEPDFKYRSKRTASCSVGNRIETTSDQGRY